MKVCKAEAPHCLRISSVFHFFIMPPAFIYFYLLRLANILHHYCLSPVCFFLSRFNPHHYSFFYWQFVWNTGSVIPRQAFYTHPILSLFLDAHIKAKHYDHQIFSWRRFVPPVYQLLNVLSIFWIGPHAHDFLTTFYIYKHVWSLHYHPSCLLFPIQKPKENDANSLPLCYATTMRISIVYGDTPWSSSASWACGPEELNLSEGPHSITAGCPFLSCGHSAQATVEPKLDMMCSKSQLCCASMIFLGLTVTTFDRLCLTTTDKSSGFWRRSHSYILPTNRRSFLL